jgi:hypothetical protein
MVRNQGKIGPEFEFKLKVPVPCVLQPKESFRGKAYQLEWVGYIGQRASESQLRGGLNLVTSQRN